MDGNIELPDDLNEDSYMPLQGKFIVNNEPLAPLVIYGVGAFMAFSGNNIYRNRGGCTAVPENGPIPAGKYWIIDRPTGGIRSQMEAWTKDMPTR